MDQRKLAEMFAQDAGCTRASALSASETVAYSYQEPIAVKKDGKVAFVTTDKWSTTTSKHTSIVAGALARAGYEVVYLSFVAFAKEDRSVALRKATAKQLRAFAAKHAGAKPAKVNRFEMRAAEG